MSNSLDPGETLSLDVPSGSKLFAYGTLVVLGGLRVNGLLYAGYLYQPNGLRHHERFSVFMIIQCSSVITYTHVYCTNEMDQDQTPQGALSAIRFIYIEVKGV